jgi:hypothetical protein
MDGCLVGIELKKPGVPVRAAFDENLAIYRQRIDTSLGHQ